MVVGGHLGNSVFFLISGIGLALSYKRAPIPALRWLHKRLIKAILPVLMFIGVIYLGHLQHFIDHIFKYLIWHDRYQLQEFLPVLWGLYLVFLPLNRLPTKALAVAGILVSLVSLLLLVASTQDLAEVPRHLPSSDIFFTLNGLLCFMLGIYVARLQWNPRRKFMVASVSVAAALGSQILHAVFASVGGWLIFANFYLNFVTVIALYAFFVSAPLHIFNGLFPLIKAMAAASLAVYIVHPKIITILDAGGPDYPYDALGVYLYAFLCAHAMTVFATHCSTWVLAKTSRR